MSKYVVTGAAGFLGSHVAEALNTAGDEVVAIDIFTDYYDPALKEANAAELDVLRVDLAEDALADAVANVDGVFHLAGQPGVRASFGESFELYVRRNVLATQRLFEAAAEADVRVVWASSSSVYGEAETYPTSEDVVPRPVSPYGITKLACEHLARAYERAFGLEVVTLRYFTLYGPRQRPDMAFSKLISALLEDRVFELYGDGSASRSFTYVADGVAATTASMRGAEPGSVFNVGGGSEATMRDVIRLLDDAAGRRLRVARRPRQAGDVGRTNADIRRISANLGWEPRVSLHEGLIAQLEWARSIWTSAPASGSLARDNPKSP